MPTSSADRWESAAPTPLWALPVACLIWLGLWYFTPGLLANGPGAWFSDEWNVATLIECGIAVVLSLLLLRLHRRYNRVLFSKSRLMWLYALPVTAALVLPFHYTLEGPLLIYMIWMPISVFWQNYLTFGLLQSYLRERLRPWATILSVAVMFWLGHVIFIAHRFGLENLLLSLGILALGLVLAWFRHSLKTLHLNLALHLTFYFVFA